MYRLTAAHCHIGRRGTGGQTHSEKPEQRLLATVTVWGAVTGLLWGGFVRMFAVEQAMSAINSVLHRRAPVCDPRRP